MPERLSILAGALQAFPSKVMDAAHGWRDAMAPTATQNEGEAQETSSIDRPAPTPCTALHPRPS